LTFEAGVKRGLRKNDRRQPDLLRDGIRPRKIGGFSDQRAARYVKTRLEPDDSLAKKQEYFAERPRTVPYQKDLPLRFGRDDDPKARAT
jgi:hypothetical protein